MKLLRARCAAATGADTGDRGSGAIAVVIFALLFIALAAFVVDGGMTLAKRERAADLAEQAARAAAQDIDVEALRGAQDLGATAPINYTNCDADIRAFLLAAGLDTDDVRASRCVAPTDADQVTVEVRLTYQPMMSGFFLTGDQHAKGVASAQSLTR
ncbi:pilus assembly protein TadG-related protein [Streptomyces sp. NBC_00433]